MSSTTVKKHKKHPQRFIFRPLAVSLLGFLASASVWSDGIVADPNAPRGQQPTVLQSNNGLPVVNIQTPTRAGVSVNQYRQFDVGEKGAVLNNSHRNVQTQLGGWIQGNPWLARGEARVIVNQVNSADPSRLNGYVEIGGRRADLVIANPAGINVNGGGFINANQVTLGAGNAVIQDGQYVGITAGSGSLNIAAGGLDTSRNDYTNLIANAVNVNGGIWANRLSVQAGGSSADTATQPNTFAIDTGALGGMYAGTIHLMVNGAEQNGIAMRDKSLLVRARCALMRQAMWSIAAAWWQLGKQQPRRWYASNHKVWTTAAALPPTNWHSIKPASPTAGIY